MPAPGGDDKLFDLGTPRKVGTPDVVVGMRNLKAHDWYEHESTTQQDGGREAESQVPIARLKTPDAKTYAERTQGQGEKWYKPKVEDLADENMPHKPRVHVKEPEQHIQKIRGKDEAWYKHDENLTFKEEIHPAIIPKVRTQEAQRIVEKVRGTGKDENWAKFDNNVGYTEEVKLAIIPKDRSDEAKKIVEKIRGGSGKDEVWYKMDRNVEDHYLDPTPKDRLTQKEAVDVKEKIVGVDTMDWYRHEAKNGVNGHQENGVPTTPKQRPQTASKIRGGDVDWYKYGNETAEQNGVANGHDVANGADTPRPGSRLRTVEAKTYVTRDQAGNCDNWYVHKDREVDQPKTPRVRCTEGQKLAKSTTSESENWFNFEANKDYYDPRPVSRCSSARGKQLLEQQRGNLERHLKMEYNAENFKNSPLEGSPMSNGTNGTKKSPSKSPSNGSPDKPTDDRWVTDKLRCDYDNKPKKHHTPQRPSKESETNAQRMNGTLNILTGEMQYQQPRQKVARTPEAAANAARLNGVAKSLIYWE